MSIDMFSGPPKERAVLKQTAVAVILVDRLSQSESFWSQAQTVADDPVFRRFAPRLAERDCTVRPADDDIAIELAAAYGNGRRRRAIIALFLRAAALGISGLSDYGQPGDRRIARLHMLELCGAVWDHDGPLLAGQQPNRPSERFWQIVEDGADRVTRRGAGQCLACGTQLAESRARGWAQRMVRRDYCDPCDAGRGTLRQRDRHGIDEVFARLGYLLEPDPIMR